MESVYPGGRRAGTRTLSRWWPLGLAAVIVAAYAAFASAIWWVQADAHAVGRRAMQQFQGDEVEALTAMVLSENHSLAERNRAVHALGQVGDSRALPALHRFYTGAACNHARFLCQRELEKAIAGCTGEHRLPGWLPLLPHRSNFR